MLAHGKGRANALYVLFYYVGGFAGISFGGVIYEHWGWSILMTMLLLVVAVPAAIAVFDRWRAAETG